MSKKLILTITNEQANALEILMKQDMAANRSAFVGWLIGQETRRRSDKKPVGRPRKSSDDTEGDGEDYTDDLPKNIPYFGDMIGAREYSDKELARESFRPS